MANSARNGEDQRPFDTADDCEGLQEAPSPQPPQTGSDFEASEPRSSEEDSLVVHSPEADDDEPLDGFQGGSFTFSEDDLIPASTGSYFAGAHTFDSQKYDSTSRRHEDDEDDTNRLYSEQSSKSFDPKISISRAVVVSSPSAAEAPRQRPQSVSRSNSRTFPLARSSSFSRRFSGFTWKQKQDGRLKQQQSQAQSHEQSHEQEADAIVYSLADAGFRLPRRRTAGQDLEASTSEESLTEQQQSQPSERRESMARKKSRMSLGSLLKFTPSDTPPKSPCDEESRSVDGQVADPQPRAREPTPDQTPRRHPTTPLPRPSPATSNPSSLPGSSHSDKKPFLLQGTVEETRKVSSSDYKPNRDELWSLFRVVEAEHQKFLSVPIDQKGEPVRRALLPFLKTTRSHHSNTSLHPLDLDRRVTILNKWWTAILDALGNRLKQQISASDRPSLLEAATSIMERPEWRAYPSPFAAVRESQGDDNPSRDTRESSDSDHDTFVTQSVHHNVRNMFVHNLFTQVNFAVEKMSLKNIPAGLVSFCGKTCAFALFFCNGIGEILLRLWDLTHHNIQRIFRSCNLSLFARHEEAAERASMLFPSGVHSLMCKSFREATAFVKAKESLPLGVEKVEWRGGWLKRWSGHESELFYTFVKEYHSIVAEFLPTDARKDDYIWAPGMIFVRAQVLANLESTLHRNPNTAATESSVEPLLAFDSLLDSSDSSIAFPGPLANSSRFMSENRLVVLIRSVTSDSCQLDPIARLLICEGFSDALRMAVESTSLYDHAACCTLCEMLQECLPLLAAFQKKQPAPLFLDPHFWTSVFRKMTESENTMTELRLYTMLFAIWEPITCIEAWKSALCFDFILEKDFFCSRFSHWCPMLRCYFQRLLCWRVARLNDDDHDDVNDKDHESEDQLTQVSRSDQQMLVTLKSRLMLAWSHFKYGASVKAGTGGVGISTAPSNPLPGRRLLIIRSNIFINPPMMPLESFQQNYKKSGADPTKDSTIAAQSAVPFFEKITASLDMNRSNKRNSSLLRSMFGYSSSSDDTRDQSPNRDRDDTTTTEMIRKDMPAEGESSRSSMYETRPLNEPPQTPSKASKQNVAGSRRIKATFKFSMELLDRYPQNNTPNEMQLSPPRLPLPAQKIVEAMPGYIIDTPSSRPKGEAARRVIYLGHALAEWCITVNECQNFFERRKSEGVLSDRLVETPTLTADTLRRPAM